MATLEQIKAKAADWISANSNRLGDSALTDIVNFQQREILREHDLRFGEYTDTFATVAAQQAYTLPAQFSRPLKFWYLDSTGGLKTLKPIHAIDDWLRVYPDPTKTGTPANYFVYGSQFWLGPTPGSILTVNRAYYRLLPDLANAADGGPNTNAFTEQAWEVLLWGALTFITTYVIEDDRKDVFKENFGRTLGQLLTEQRGAEWSDDILQSEEDG